MHLLEMMPKREKMQKRERGVARQRRASQAADVGGNALRWAQWWWLQQQFKMAVKLPPLTPMFCLLKSGRVF